MLLCYSNLVSAGHGSVGAVGADGVYVKNGLRWGPGIRMNHVQQICTHNSYHREVSLEERPYHALLLSNPQDYYYSHVSLDDQAEYQSVRGFELDIWADPDGGKYATPLIRKLAHLPFPSDPAMNKSGAKILHVSDADVGVTCYTLVECLRVIRGWSKKNPQHIPIANMIEFKVAGNDMAYLGGATPLQWNNTELLASLDAEFRSVFDADEMITPDDIRRDDMTLEESILEHGWPELESARGRVMFFMDDGATVLSSVRAVYVDGRPSAEGRVIFPQSEPGQPDCAFQKLNTPTGDGLANIRQQVKAGYWIRTRADVPIDTVTSNDTTSMRDAAFASGAQMVSTDWPAVGMAARYNTDYVVGFPEGIAARCNPITAPKHCSDAALEPSSLLD